MVVTSLDSKTRGDIYGNVKKIINGNIAVSPWMTEDSLKCAARRYKQKISNNQILNKEESERDKSEHQTSVLGLILNTTINGGIPKGSTLKNKKNSKRECMYQIPVSLVCSTARTTWNIDQQTDLSSDV